MIMKDLIRVVVYLAIVGLVIAAVIRQRGVITNNRSREVASIMSLWDDEGRPVRVRKAVMENLVKDQKITLVREDNGVFRGYVTKDVKKKIYPEQAVYLVNGDHEKRGEVQGVDENIDMNTGLYKIYVRMDDAVMERDRVIAYIENTSGEKGFSVSNDAIDLENGNEYIWKVVNGRAERNKVKVGERYGNLAVITEGIDEGDVLIVEGQKLINEADPVNII